MSDQSEGAPRARVLIVDDDASLRRALKDRIAHWGHAVEEAADGREALERTARASYDLVILDLYMPGMTGLEVLREWKAGGFETPVVVLTAQGSVEAAVEAMRAGAEDFLQKPADFELLRRIVERSIERSRLLRQNRALTERLDASAGFVSGPSPSMRSLLETAARAAQSNATVLLTGESGSGKQVLAEYIHRQSPRAAGPFIYVNCVALSDELIESTLFGHERGAFTGAVARKEGRLEAAAGGTAFLDEVGDVTPRLQTKLLHFLETGAFERVGGTRTLTVDCRIIAATNRDLPAAVRGGAFREDLFYRLNVVHLPVPALRDRREDIPALAQSFLARFAAELRRGSMRFAPETLEALTAHRWPGNVRQLKNAIERMAVLAPGDELTPDLLPPEMSAADAAGAPVSTDRPLKEAVSEFKRSYIRAVLASCGGNQTRAAERLGLQRTFLNRLIKEMDL
jgi:DNA-binding NtrC family response regulator